MIRAALLLALALLAAPAAAESVTVLRVIDGDTIVTAEHGTVRLRGIDAPESCQAWGPQATRTLRVSAVGAPTFGVLTPTITATHPLAAINAQVVPVFGALLPVILAVQGDLPVFAARARRMTLHPEPHRMTLRDQ